MADAEGGGSGPAFLHTRVTHAGSLASHKCRDRGRGPPLRKGASRAWAFFTRHAFRKPAPPRYQHAAPGRGGSNERSRATHRRRGPPAAAQKGAL